MTDRDMITKQLELLIACSINTLKGMQVKLDAGDLAGALISGKWNLAGVESTIKALYKDYGKTLPARERKARYDAYRFFRDNMGLCDAGDGYDADPLGLNCTPTDIAEQLIDAFDEDAPADLIARLRAC